MRDLKEIFIKKLASPVECPSDLELIDYCQDDCEECWRQALKNIDIIEREEDK